MIYTAFLVGLMGSLHCVGMCGPLVLAMPLPRKAMYSQLKARLLYNLGRTTTYAFLGAIVGLLGRGFVLTASQQWLSILVGVLIASSLLIPLRYVNQMNVYLPTKHLSNYLKSKFALLFQRKGLSTSYFFGVLNGFLPCGLVYLALAGALATGDLVSGIFYMILFGLGTIPLMLAMGLGFNLIKPSIRNIIHKKLLPGFVLILAFWFVLRGMNLGVPYLSPKMHEHKAVVEDVCCSGENE